MSHVLAGWLAGLVSGLTVFIVCFSNEPEHTNTSPLVFHLNVNNNKELPRWVCFYSFRHFLGIEFFTLVSHIHTRIHGIQSWPALLVGYAVAIMFKSCVIVWFFDFSMEFYWLKEVESIWHMKCKHAINFVCVSVCVWVWFPPYLHSLIDQKTRSTHTHIAPML